MARILMRAAQSPFDNYTGFQTFVHDKIWSNLGNLLFSHSVYKTLYSKNTQIDIMDKPAGNYCAEELNQQYDVLVLPFANAFRSDFAAKLQAYTDLINKLTIPVVVTGIGIQADINEIRTTKFDFDPVVKEFIKAVLNHSTSVGVRGEYTYEYLCRLGYKNHTKIIGCPSMYMFGEKLPPLQVRVSHDDFSVNLNGKRADSDEMKQYLFYIEAQARFFPQTTRELEMLYTGRTVDSKDKFYPASLESSIFNHTEVRFPLSVQGWINDLKKGNMSIGTRIHGSVASVLSGLPTYVICTDSRVLELAEYHQIPHCTEAEFDYCKSVYELYETIDFEQVHRNHSSRYQNYVDFMTENGLTVQMAPFKDFYDEFNKIIWNDSIVSITTVENSEMIRRLNETYRYMFNQRKSMRETIQKLKCQNNQS